MIAKFISLLVGLLFSITLFGNRGFHTQNEIKQLYQIAFEFDINPPGLTKGYPLWYCQDSLPVDAYVFLSAEKLEFGLSDFEKINDSVYVTTTDIRNAQIIRNSIKRHDRFVIIPDSCITVEFLTPFLEDLRIECGSETYYDFVSSKKNYTRYELTDHPYNCFPESWIRYLFLNRLQLLMNMNRQYMLEGHFIEFEEIAELINYHLSVNYPIGDDINGIEYMLYSSKDTLDFQDSLIWIHNDLQLRRRLHRKFGSFKKTHHGMVFFNLGGRHLTCSDIYGAFGEINTGISNARDSISQYVFHQPYENFFAERAFMQLDYIHYCLPGKIGTNTLPESIPYLNEFD